MLTEIAWVIDCATH